MDRTRKILHNYNLLFPEYFLMLILVMTNKQHNFYIFITIIQKGTLTVFSTPNILMILIVTLTRLFKVLLSGHFRTLSGSRMVMTYNNKL